MKSAGQTINGRRLNERLATSGLRFTAQRQHIYNVLLQKRDHPSAEEVFIRAKKGMPDISMATVYNCLDTLVRCGLVRLVTLDRGPTRYCSNMQEHGHFYCDACGSVYDFSLAQKAPPATLRLPAGYRPDRYEISVHGTCPDCGRHPGHTPTGGTARGAGFSPLPRSGAGRPQNRAAGVGRRISKRRERRAPPASPGSLALTH